MLDVKWLEREPEVAKIQLASRGDLPELTEVFKQIAARKVLIVELQEGQEALNQASKALQKSSKEEINDKRSALKDLSQSIKQKQGDLREVEAALEANLLAIPNVPRADVPVGSDESDNVEYERVGSPKQFDFEVRDHVALGALCDGLDFDAAAKVSGARFAFLKGDLSRLNRALMNYFLDYHTAEGDQEITPPFMVRELAMQGTGQLPKFKEDAFEISNTDSPYYLIPTAEVPLTNYMADEIIDESALPIRFCAYSPCFRAEAGSAGRDTKGLIRQHQFEKVEMVRFCLPEHAKAELDAMVARASFLLRQLGLPHRLVKLCTGDLGFSAEKTIDLEVYLPGQGKYREISSCSSFGSFQARRAKIRYRPASSGAGKKPKPQLLATLNGSGLPLGRTLVAIIENHQNKDGSINVPEVLQPYMGGKKVILPSAA